MSWLAMLFTTLLLCVLETRPANLSGTCNVLACFFITLVYLEDSRIGRKLIGVLLNGLGWLSLQNTGYDSSDTVDLGYTSFDFDNLKEELVAALETAISSPRYAKPAQKKLERKLLSVTKRFFRSLEPPAYVKILIRKDGKIKAQGAEIAELKEVIREKDEALRQKEKELTWHERGLKTSNASHETQEAKIDSEEITLCDEEKSILQSVKMDLEKKAFETSEAVAEQTIRDWEERFGSLADIGFNIRARKYEQQRPRKVQNQAIIDAGIKAAHHGEVIADAAMYQDFGRPDRRLSDPARFIVLHVVDPEFAWRNRNCTELVDILNWRVAMKDFYTTSCAGSNFELSNFEKLFKEIIAAVSVQENLDPAYFSKNYRAKQLHQLLKVSHDSALAAQKEFWKNRFS
ncbi:hypothetical protein DL95DRAFT_407517 [Leptodontidium sp. 2 PMI_412]|nr:hypothetical protein DL95DRAFT_407517 [Leptodontidium sp. 2 PMI_412]